MSIKNDHLITGLTVISLLAFFGGFTFSLFGIIEGSAFGWHSLAIGTITAGTASLGISITSGTILLKNVNRLEKQAKKLEENLRKIRATYDLNL